VTARRVNARRRVVLMASIALALAACGLVAASSAHAVFPGGTGKLMLGNELYDPPDPTWLPAPGAAQGVYNMRWSADGTRLAGQGPGGVHNTRIWVADADQNVRAVTAPPAGGFDDAPAWSPDGKEIAFRRGTLYGCGTSTCQRTSVEVVNVESGAVRTLIGENSGVGPAMDWSPDGSRIVVKLFGGIHLVDAASGARVEITQVYNQDYNNPRFSPDGQMIVLGQYSLTEPDVGTDVALIRLDGTVVDAFDRVRTLGYTNPTFTPDGQWISFSDCRPGCGIWARRVPQPTDLPGTVPVMRLDFGRPFDEEKYPDWQPIPVAVRIATGPSGTIGEQDVVFSFSLAAGAEVPAGEYRCRLEGPQGRDWAACESPASFGKLAEGDYTFSVRFVPKDEDPEGFPVTRRSFKVDRTAPVVSIDERPPATTQSADVTVRFSSSSVDGVTFRCRLDGGPEYDCTSPQRLASLAVGSHSLSIVARDAVGNASAPVVVSWEVKEAPPEELPPGVPVVEPPPPPPPPAGGGPGALPSPPPPAAADRATCGAAGGTVTIGVLTAVSLGECFRPTLVRGRMLNATSSPVKVNGVLLTPEAGTKIAVDARLSADVVVWTGPVDMSIGSWSVPVGFSGTFGVRRDQTDEPFIPKFLKVLEDQQKLEFAGQNFAVEPTFKLSGDDGGSTKLGLKLELPAMFRGLPGGKYDKEANGGLTFEISLTAANTKAPRLAASAGIQRAYLFGKLQLEDIGLAVDSGPPLSFEGSGKLKLVPFEFAKGLGGDANVELKIELGEDGGPYGLRKLAVQASDLEKHLGYGIFFQRLGGEITSGASASGGVDWSLSANAGLSFGPKLPLKPVFEGEAVSLDAALKLSFADQFTLKATGEGKIVTVPVGNSEFEWTPAKGRIDLKGELNLDVGGYGFKGVIENAFFETAQDAKPRYFNVEASSRLLLGGKLAQLDGLAQTVLSERGWAACYGDTVRVGVASLWTAGKPELFARSCDIGPYRSAGVSATPARAGAGAAGTGVRAAQAANSATFTVAPGTRVKVLALQGATGAPRVRLNGPGGQVVDASSGAPVLDRPDAIVVPDDSDFVTRIVLRDPPAGTWSIEPVPGADAPIGLQIADQLPAVQISASQQRASRGRRELTWRLTPIDGQGVAFFERAGNTLTPIATTDQASGTITYTPAAGKPTRRTIEALVSQDGMPRARRTLLTYRQALAPLRNVRGIHRKGGWLRWRAAPGSPTYAILLRTADQTTYTHRTRRTRLRLPARARTARVLTQIVTITADGRTSTPAIRRLAAQRTRSRR